MNIEETETQELPSEFDAVRAMPDGPDEVFRAEVMVRLFSDLRIGNYDNGGGLYRDCWVPTSAVDGSGQIIPARNTYRKVTVRGRGYQAHDAVLILINDRFFRDGEIGMHLCNNPACVNPIHLMLGNAPLNSAHAKECGRLATGERNGHSTCPGRTPRGDLHYRSQLKGAARQTALELLKKYCNEPGFADAIADYLNVSVHAIYYLKRIGAHLAPAVTVSDLELTLNPWVPKKEQRPKPSREELERIVREIRQTYHDTPEYARTGMVIKLADEYCYCVAWIRKILRRDAYAEIAPDIPRPDSYGIGTRRHEKLKSGEVNQ